MEAGFEMLDGLNWWQLHREYLKVRKEIYAHQREIGVKLEWTAEAKRRMDELDPRRKKRRI
ncbi:MAG TPA: hypothetical protein DCZ75_06475 [Geobacter sp.]|nr:hypothetical protein [Geobacter sp.]